MTALQHQCLLAALGLYPCREIDGIWGAKSRAAAQALRRRMGLSEGGMDGEGEDAALRALAEGLPEEPVGSFWNSIRHWNREEFRCRCGGRYCSGFPAEPSEVLVRLADDIREHFGVPAHASSGLRCPDHNRAEGGVENSRHISGKALDFRVEGIPGNTLLAYARSDPRVRYAYQINQSPYVHMDVN